MKKADALGKLAAIRDQLEELERQLAERMDNEQSLMTLAIENEHKQVGKKLAKIELIKAREKIKQYNVS